MEPPIEAIKGALWWLEDGLDNADLTKAEYRKTKKFRDQLRAYIQSVANNPVEPTASKDGIRRNCTVKLPKIKSEYGASRRLT